MNGQVLVTAEVWKHAPKTTAWIPEGDLKRHPGAKLLASPPVARGLSASDFRIFDNGEEQKINYLQEFDSSFRHANRQWYFVPDTRGTWSDFVSADFVFSAPWRLTSLVIFRPHLEAAAVTRYES
jgi:hypothetical protein